MINRILLYVLTVSIIISGYLYIGGQIDASKKIHNVDNALKTVNGTDEDLVKYEAEESFLNNQTIVDVVGVIVLILVTVAFWKKTFKQYVWNKHVKKYVKSTCEPE
jgi:hypothetical protein